MGFCKIEKENRILLKNENRGSTLVTVIIVVAFLSVLATVMLYLSGENYRMKIVDRKNKESFYEGEEVLDLMRVQLARDVAKASHDAYLNSSTLYVLSEESGVREENYNSWFRHYIQNRLDYYKGLCMSGDKAAMIQTLFPDAYNIADNSFSIKVNDKELNCTISDIYFCSFTTEGSEYYCYITGRDYDDPRDAKKPENSVNTTTYKPLIELTITDPNNQISVISTCFEITTPKLNWSEEDTDDNVELDYMDCVKYFNYNKD